MSTSHKLGFMRPQEAMWRTQVAKNRNNPQAIYEALRKECFANMPLVAFASAWDYAKLRFEEAKNGDFAKIAHAEVVAMQAAIAKLNNPTFGGGVAVVVAPKVQVETSERKSKSTGTEG